MPDKNPTAINIAKYLTGKLEFGMRSDIRGHKLYALKDTTTMYEPFSYLDLQLEAVVLFEDFDPGDTEDLIQRIHSNTACVKQTVDLIKIEDGLYLPPPKPYILNFEDFIIDLRDCTTRYRIAEDHITSDDRRIRYTLKEFEAADERLVTSIMKRIHDKEEIRDYILRLTAAHLYSGSMSRKIHFHLGEGGNGKGLFHSLIELAFDGYLERVEQKTLANYPNPQQKNPQIAALFEAKYLLVEEGSKQIRFDSSLIKTISGDGVLKSRCSGGKNQSMRVVSEIEWECNNLPKFDIFDQAMKDRVVVIPYLNRFEGDEEFGRIHVELLEERRHWKKERLADMVRQCWSLITS
jgi:phage/plasmid-associated DNA primase